MSNDTKAFDFSFKDPTRKFNINPDELQYAPDEYDEEMEQLEDKTPVVVFTRNHRIEGKIALVPGARLTDYVVGANQFIAMTEVAVKDKTGKILLNSPFLDVNRDQIEIIFPADLATFHKD
jgi:hypothetical protein